MRPSRLEWLEKLIQNAERCCEEEKSLPVRIISSKDKGFVVKVSGLYAFIFYNHMPWEYPIMADWSVVSAHLIGKVFYGKIHKVKRDPLSIIIDGKVEQFRKPDLFEGGEYFGLVVQKATYGAFIDLGYHFNWKHGSLLGLMHKSQFEEISDFQECNPGDVVEVGYQGLRKDGHMILGNKCDLLDWVKGRPQELVGQVIWVKVKTDSKLGNQMFMVIDKYAGHLPISSNIYHRHEIRKIKKAKSELLDGEIISCEVIGFNEKRKFLSLRWVKEFNSNSLSNAPIRDLIDEKTYNKMKSLVSK